MINKKYKKVIRDAMSIYNLRVRFVRGGGSSCIMSQNIIEIDTKEVDSHERLWSLIYHELAHSICYWTNLYYRYHNSKNDKEFVKYAKRYGLRAERFVDRKAKQMMKKDLPYLKYIPCYDTEFDVKWYYKWLNK